MIDLIPSLWQFLTLLLMMFASLMVSYLLLYNPRLSLLQFDCFNVEPFTCNVCMTFWCNLVPNIILAYIWSPFFALWGLITASALAYSVSRANKSL